MIIDAPRRGQTEALRSLWKQAFGDSDAFLDTFWQTAFSFDRCRCVTADGNVAAALYWFDCHYRGGKLAYLYAVATAEGYRGRGLCHALMEDTHRHLASCGYDGTVLVPGSRALFEFYGRMGYEATCRLDAFECNASQSAAELWRIDACEYGRLRRQFLPEDGVLQEGENLPFLETQASLYAGRDFLLAARGEGECLFGVELLGNRDAAPQILRTLGFAQGSFRAEGEGQPFAMYRPLGQIAETPPRYFGLAFD